MIEDYFGKVINPAEEFTYGEVERQGVVIFGGSVPACERLLRDLAFYGVATTEDYR